MKKVVFLVDMNSFFISCEMARNPELKGVPAAVAGDPKNRSGIILSANYDARKYNVKTTMLVHKARELCPGIILVPPEHGYYEKMSREVMKILSGYSPVMQQNSIDEAWLDLTGCERLFGKPCDIAGRIMEEIMNKLDLWCSIGISENKFLAKMASEMKKPQGITEVWVKDVPEKIWPLPVRRMYGIGAQTEKKLSNLAIYNIGDIARCEVSLLAGKFGKYGEELHRLANGIDYSPVTGNPQHDSKSISRSTTLPADITDLEYARSIILRLAEEIGAEARKSSLKGRTISIAIKYGDFQAITRQGSIPATFLTRDIYKAGSRLLEDNWNKNRPVRLLGIGLSDFGEENLEQITMYDLSGRDSDSKREERLERAMDAIREKYGHDKIKRAKVIKDENGK
jgi:DNA polymerase-4